jgi:hypothetical protein
MKIGWTSGDSRLKLTSDRAEASFRYENSLRSIKRIGGNKESFGDAYCKLHRSLTCFHGPIVVHLAPSK